MKKNKRFLKIMAFLLSVVMLVGCLPTSVLAADTATVPNSTQTGDVTLQDVAAGAASIFDLYGEDYVLHIPDAAETYDPSNDNRVRSEEGNSLNVIVTDNCDGTNTMTIYDYPVKFINEKGEIEDISLDLTAAGNGGFKNKKSNIKTEFPQKAKDGISLSHEDVNIKLTPKFDMPLTNTLVSPFSSVTSGKASAEPIAKEVNATKLDKKAVSYYYNSSTRLEYSLTYTGFKEDIVVSEYTGQTEYKFTLETGGLTLKESDGSYYLTDENGEVKANFGDIVILTADGKNDTFGYMTHETVKENQSYELTVHVDAEWLADQNTAYPIRIDPTVTLNPTDSNNSNSSSSVNYPYYWSAVEDVTIYDGYDSNCDDANLYVGYREGYGVSRVLMKFPGLVLADVLSSKNIRSAEVYLYDNARTAAAMKVIAYMFTGDAWEEETASRSSVNINSYTHFLSQQTVSSSIGSTFTGMEHWYKFNIIDYVKACMDVNSGHIDKGILFKAADSVETAGADSYKRFTSFNGTTAERPYIVVTYDNENFKNTQPFGWFDKVTDTYASGWAWCVDAPDEAVTVNIELTNKTTGQVFMEECTANIYRADVKNAGYGTGNYGFGCPLDWSEYTPGEYTVRAIAVSPGGTLSDANDCYELQSPKSYSNPTYDQIIPEDAYYINNKEHGTYLLNGIFLNRSSLLSSLSDGIGQWMFEQSEGGYIIRNLYEDEKYLAVNSDSSSNSVSLNVYNANEKYKYIWDIQLAEYGGCYIRNRYNGKYLFINNDGKVEIDSSVGTVGTAINNQHVWRIVDTTEYGNTESYSSRELTDEAFFDGLYVMVGKTASIPYSSVIPNTLWAEPSDFTYEIVAKNSDGVGISTTAISIDQTTGRVTCNSLGVGEQITITATHKVTGHVFDNIKVHILSSDLPLIDKELNVWNAVSHEVGYWSKSVIKVYVHAFDKPDNYENFNLDYDTQKEDFNDAVTHAIDQWEVALTKEDSTPYIDFVMTDDIEEADIQWYFGTDLQLCDNDNELFGGKKFSLYTNEIQGTLGGSKSVSTEHIGYLSYGNDRKIVAERSKTVLYTRFDELSKLWGTGRYTLDDLADWQKVVTTHELGHALGYSGHTGDKYTLMYPSSNPDSSYEINNKELAYIQHIYELMKGA